MAIHPRNILLTLGLGLVLIGTLALWPVNRHGQRQPAVHPAAPPTVGTAAAGVAAPAAAAVPSVPSASAPAAAPVPNAVDRLVAQAEELDRRDVPDESGVAVRRQRLLHMPEFKYPHLLVNETVTPTPANRGECVTERHAMVADRVLVKLRQGATEADLVQLNAVHGARLDGPALAPGLYLVQLAQPDLDAVTNAIAMYTQAAGTVAYAEPDYLLYALETPNDPNFGGLWGMHNIGQKVGAATVTAGGTTRPGTALEYSGLAPTPGIVGALYHCGLGRSGEFPAGVSGNIALIQRGEISFAAKAGNAKAAGAVAVIVYNNVSGPLNGTLGTPGDWLPALGVSYADGAALLALGNVAATVTIAGSVSDADIDAPEAWDISHGSSSVVVGVIDTGIDYNHPDLATNVWTNPGEIAGNGIDDDSNGYVDDVHGYDFYNDDGDPLDDHFHGTHCAGTIGAVGNNGVGVAGVCWNVRLMALKVFNSSGMGSADAALRALHYATQRGVKLTSNSWGGSPYSQALKDEIDAAGAAGALFVAAAGNEGSNNDSSPFYPASYPSGNVIAVAATDCNDALASFSCYGANSVDLGAPGVDIYSTFPTYMTAKMAAAGYSTHYAMISGTSMATPHVAGVCALLKAVAPSMAPADMKDWLLRQTDPAPALTGKCVTGGRLNAAKTAGIAPGPNLRFAQVSASDAGGNADGFNNPGETVHLTVTLRNLGLTSTTGVHGTLASADPDVTVADAAAAFADSGGYGSLSLALDSFTIAISPACPTPHQATLNLSLTDAASRTWTDSFTVMIYTSSHVSGVVTLDGAPLAGATVQYSGPLAGAATTDAGGAYHVVMIDGTATLYATQAGYLATAPVTVTVPPGRTDANFAFTTATISGRVTTLAGVNPISGATVEYAGDLTGTATTDASGAYIITSVCGREATLVLTAKATGYVDSAAITTTIPPSRNGVDFALGKPQLTFSATSLAGTVEEGAALTADLTLGNLGDAALTWALRAQTEPLHEGGALIREFPFPLNTPWLPKSCWPRGLAYDGSALWVTFWFDQAIYKLDPTDGHLLGTLDLSALPQYPAGLYRSGNVLWVTFGGPTPHRLVALDADTGAILRTLDNAPLGYPYGVSAGEGALWVVDRAYPQHITQLHPDTGAALNAFALPVTANGDFCYGDIYGLSYFNGALWTSSMAYEVWNGLSICKADADNGTRQKAIYSPTSDTMGLASDGMRYLWATDDVYGRIILLDTGEVAWLRANPPAGTVAPGDSQTVTLTFDAAVLDPGTYVGTATVKANDPSTPITVVPVTLTVTAAPRLVHAAQTFTDAAAPAAGDGDGAAEPGETIALTIAVQNTGHGDAAGLSGRLTTADAYATVSSDTAAFPDAAVGATVASATSFVVQLADNCPNERIVALNLAVSDSAGRHWNIPVTLHVAWRCELTGTVTDQRTGAPLAGATVTVTSGVSSVAQSGFFTAVTDANGDYRFTAIPPGSWIATATRLGYASLTATPAFPPDVVVLDFALAPANLVVSPASLSQSLRSGQTASQALTLGNLGIDTLSWSLSTGQAGYSVSTSDQPGGPAYSWQEIAGTGTKIENLTYSNTKGPFDLGFAFPFYGQSFASFRICGNGWLSFTDDLGYPASSANCQLPGSAAPANLVAFFWTYLNFISEPYSSNSAWYQQVDAETLIIEFKDVGMKDIRQRLNCQVILHADGRIVCQYQTVGVGAAAAACTVGLQNADRTTGVTVVHKAPLLHEQMAIQFTPMADWLTLSPVTGTAAGHDAASLLATFDATGLAAGTYRLNLQVFANDLATPVVNVPVTLTVAPDANQPPTIDSPAWADANPVTLPAGTTVHVVASDPDGDPLTYAWSKVSGAGTATFAASGAADCGVTFSTPGSYVLRATVSDGRGASVTSDVTVSVTAGSGVDPRADLNHDGVVNALDLQIVIANFGMAVGTPGCDARADANADGVVNALDLQIVIANFGQTVP